MPVSLRIGTRILVEQVRYVVDIALLDRIDLVCCLGFPYLVSGFRQDLVYEGDLLELVVAVKIGFKRLEGVLCLFVFVFLSDIGLFVLECGVFLQRLRFLTVLCLFYDLEIHVFPVLVRYQNVLVEHLHV